MKSIQNILIAGSIMVLSGFTVQQSVQWEISNDYSIEFSATKAEGIFKTLKGEVQFDAQDLAASKFNFIIEVNSINTGNGIKNKHAKSDKWFDAEKYPNIEFKSNAFSKTEEAYSVRGKMKMHGIEKEVHIPFTYENNVFAARFSLNRLDYKVGTMEGSSKKVSNEIKLEVSIPVTKN